MINITIAENGAPSSEMIKLGNEFENLDEVIQFTFPKDLESLHKYVVAKTYDPKKKENITRVTPLVNNRFVVGTAITKVVGTWMLYTLSKSYSVDEEGNITNTERVSISDPIIAVVNENDIDVGNIEKIELDPNIKIIYDELISFKKELESNEETRKSNEAVRVENETSRVSAETARSEAEATRVENENSRLNAESSRASAEVARANAEKTRASNEATRTEAEEARANAEESRVEAENTRSSNEQARVNAESERTQYETLRRQSEEIRLSNEESRSNAEKSRVQSEQERINAENERATSETARASAETARATAETNRESAERLRSEAETSRINAEQSRADAEQLRVSAENERVTSETARAEAENRRDSVITKLREDLDANTKADEKTSRSLTALWDLNKGISYRFEEDNEKAYHKQVLSGAKLGAVNKIGGRTIVYNQLFKTDNIDNGSITITYADNIVTINGTTSNNWVNFSALDEKLNVVGKFYIKMIIIKNDDDLSFKYGWLNRSVYTDNITSGSVSAIHSQTSSDLEKGLSTGISWAKNTGSVTFNDVKIQITIVNLTKMFGEGNEPSTVEEFESMFPNSYYPYNEGELMSMSVNEVEEIGKNIFKCENFSCYGLDGTNKPILSNSYGTSINNTEPSNSVTVTQSKVANEDVATSYSNGYFCVSFKPLTMNGEYVFSLDITPSNKLISSPKFMVLFNGDGNYGSAIADTQSIQIGIKSKLFFTLNVNNKKVKYIEIRNSGVSGIFENFQIEEGNTNTTFSPYHENHYAIPQAILELSGYGASGNYVDFEKKEYHKGNEIIDISDIIGDTFQEPFNVESGGSLTFKNKNGDGYQVAVPSDVQYVVSLSEVNS